MNEGLLVLFHVKEFGIVYEQTNPLVIPVINDMVNYGDSNKKLFVKGRYINYEDKTLTCFCNIV